MVYKVILKKNVKFYSVYNNVVKSAKIYAKSLMFPFNIVARASTAIGVSPVIKEIVQKQAHSTRLTLKEVILMGMLAIDKLDDQGRQELADQVHQMQVNGDI